MAPCSPPSSDCAHYLGEKPCAFGRPCEGCPHYTPQGKRILLIKLGAMGDALRTTPILPALKAAYPRSQITWVTDTASFELLEGCPAIDRLLVLGFESRLILEAETFDRLYCFDKSPLATALANHVDAGTKKGFRMTPYGTLGVYDDDARYALQLGLSDALKFHENQRTYQDVLFEMAGLRYRRERYALSLSDEHRREAERILAHPAWRPGRPVIGLNTGCGNVFRTKAWGAEAFLELARAIHGRWGANLLLLGGEAEREKNRQLQMTSDVPLLDTGADNPVKVFAALLERCDVVVTGDTLAMHLAIALRRPVVALFGSTCPQEIDLYGNGIKLFAGVDCAPCYRAQCDTMRCMEAVTDREVLDAVQRLLPEDHAETDMVPSPR